MKLWKFLLLLGALVAGGGVLLPGFNFLVLPSLVHRNKVVPVPDLRGPRPRPAVEPAATLDLRSGGRERPASDHRARALILEQVPAPQAGIRARDAPCRWSSAAGRRPARCRDLAGLSLRQAEITLQREHYRLGRVLRVRRDGVTEPPWSSSSSPQAGTRPAARAPAVDLVVAEPAPPHRCC